MKERLLRELAKSSDLAVDPINRLKMIEGAILFSLLMLGLFYYLEWRVLFAIVLFNTLFVIYKYTKERKDYKLSGGVL